MPKELKFNTDWEKTACIVNPYAANRKWKRNKLLQKYIREKLRGQVLDTHKDKAYTIETAKFLCKNKEVILAAGGDGTIADVIQGILESGRSKQVSLGIIPLGSGNAIRDSLGIPKTIKGALRVLTEGEVKEIDLIDFGGKVGTFGSVGATAQVLYEKLKYKIPGFFGHLLASRIMLNLSRKEQEVELLDGMDDEGRKFKNIRLRLKVFDIVIGKTNHFGYSWKIAPQARIDDGYIDITFFEISAWKYLLYFPGIYFGTFQKTQKHYKAKKIIIRGKDLPVQYNGELLDIKDEITIRIIPKALRIISPAKK